MTVSGKMFRTESSGETKKVGKQIAERLLRTKIGGKSLKPLICLYGNLGSGKTTFVQGLGDGFRIKKKIIKSPTFVFLHQYQGKLAKLYHFDFYRIKHPGELLHELHEIHLKDDGFIAIEWAERIRKFLPKNRIDIFFEHEEHGGRKIRILAQHSRLYQ